MKRVPRRNVFAMREAKRSGDSRSPEGGFTAGVVLNRRLAFES